MYALDFEYDGIKLSDYGMMICEFGGSGGLETVSSGSDLTFNTVKTTGSDIFRFYGTKYEECYSTTFQICKNKCATGKKTLSPLEVSAIQRWLCRKDGYHEFKIIQDDYADIHWKATFSAQQINLNGEIVGMELTLHTDSPYAYGSEQSATFSVYGGTGISYSLYDQNDEIGYIYPTVEITSNYPGYLMIYSDLSPKKTIIEFWNSDVVVLDGNSKTITSKNGYKYNDNRFNFIFPKLVNTFDNRKNVFTLNAYTGKCFTVTFSYCPKIKVGL